ncbi:6,7-dimethyl-8-ribityllumazine synthase [Bacteroidota bacterium]
MANKKKDLSSYNAEEIPSAENLSFGFVVAEWNSDITNVLLDGAYKTLLNHGVEEENIIIKYVPGTFELPFGAKSVYESHDLDAIICIGCVIKGETPHFEYICQGVTQGIMHLNTQLDVPFIFGVLTTNNMQQAKDRAGGKHGNKGVEAAITAIKMAVLNNELIEESILREDDLEGYFDDELLN